MAMILCPLLECGESVQGRKRLGMRNDYATCVNARAR